MSTFETELRHSEQEVDEHPRPLHAQSKNAIAGKQEWRPVPLNYLEPDIPVADLNVDFSTIAGVNGSEDSAEKVRIEKRKSNLLKLNEENEKLRWELKALSDKLEAAERQRAQQQPLETRIE